MKTLTRIAIALEMIAVELQKKNTPKVSEPKVVNKGLIKETSKFDSFRNRWTKEEDAILISAKSLGMGWEYIMSRLPNRSRSACMTRYSVIKKA